MMIRRKTLLAACAAFTLGAGLGVPKTPGAAAQDVPTAPPPRVVGQHPKTPPALAALEAEVEQLEAQWEQSASRARLRREDLARLEAAREIVNTRLAAGQTTVAQRDRVLQLLGQARQEVEATRTLASAADQRYQAARDRLAFPTGRGGAAVGGTLAVDVTFPAAERFPVAAAVLDLVLGATDATPGVPVTAWDAAQLGCHVWVRFPGPTAQARVVTRNDLRLHVAEVLVPLPLTRGPGGFVLVRDGDQIARLSKYPPAACARFQEVLAAATPAGQNGAR